jgi:outer membrane protein assembly factor BamA
MGPRPSLRFRPALFALLCLPVAGRAGRLPPETDAAFRGWRIERVHIVTRQVFDTEVPSENTPIFRAANALHFTSKDRTVRTQLLFRPGDAYDPALARESERALRNVLRLRDVRIRAMPVGERRVDVVVETQDTWSLEPYLSVSGAGSDTKIRVGIRERNLGGYGKQVGFQYKQDPELVSRNFAYDDPSLLGSHWRMSGAYQDTAEGSARSLAIGRPFLSSLTPYAVLGSGSYERGDTVLYEAGEEIDRTTHENKKIGGALAFSVGSTTRRVRRLGFGYDYKHDRLSTPQAESGAVADDVYHLFGPTLDWQKINYATMNRIKLYSRDEDYNLAPTLKTAVGLSQSRWVPGAQNALFLKARATHGHPWGVEHFGLATLDVDGRYENGWKNARTGLNLEYYNRVLPRSTWAGHLAWDQILHPDPDEQLTLGGDTGLRGYPAKYFSGNRSFLFNLENRLFLIDDVVKFFEIGAVGFFDAGYAWPRGQAIRFEDLRADYGAGIRIHLPRASLGQVIRLDIAWPTRAADGDRSPVVTFATNQVF